MTPSPRRRTHVVLLVVVGAAAFGCLASPRPASAATCQVGRTKPLVVATRYIDAKFDPQGLARLLSDQVFIGLMNAVPEVEWMSTWDSENLVRLEQTRQGFGGGDGVGIADLMDALGSEFVLAINLTQPNKDTRVISVFLQSGHTGQQFLRTTTILPADTEAMFNVLDNIVRTMSTDLYCTLVGRRIRPIRPNLSIPEATPSIVAPGGIVSARVTLTDANDGQPDPGYLVSFVVLTSTNRELVARPDGVITGPDGVAQQQITMPRTPGTYRIEARFVREDGQEAPRTRTAVRVSQALGALQISAPQVALLVGQGEQVTARLQRNLTVGAGEVIDFVASGGTLSASSATTDAAGEATIAYQAPADTSLVDVTATAPATPPAPSPLRAANAFTGASDPQPDEPPLTAVLTLVVDGQVTIAMTAPDTIEGGTTDITVDINIGSTPAANIPVTFTLNGPGQLSTTSASTDAAGRVAIAYSAPTASSSITVTVSAIVDGQTYTKTVTFAVASASPSVFTLQYIGATNCTDGTGLVELRFTPYPGGTVPPPSLPYTLSQAACGGHVDLTVQRASDNGVELDADLDEAANQYASGSAVVAATLTRDGVLEIDLNPAWATSTPDPFPGQYGLYGDVVIQDASFKILGRFTYDFTNQRVVRSDAPAILAAGSYYIVMQYGGSNNAANVGRGRLATVRIR